MILYKEKELIIGYYKEASSLQKQKNITKYLGLPNLVRKMVSFFQSSIIFI